MKLIILKDNLKEGLNRVERAIGDTISLPVLKHVLCEAQESGMRLTTTNLEMGIETKVVGKVGEIGSITVPFQALYAIIQGVDTERITLETEGNILLVSTDNYHARIQGMGSEDFPIIPKIQNKTTTLSISAEVFTDAVSKVIYAAQFSEIRPELGGVLIDFQMSILKLVATDSFRLAEKTILTKHIQTNATSGFKVIVPLKTMQEVQRIFSNEETLSITIDEHQILVSGEKTQLVSRLIGGSYPDYEQIIPKTNDLKLSLKRDQLMSAVRLVSTFSGKVNDIKIRMREGTKALEVYSASHELGENAYLVPIKAEGKELKEISFNWRYLMDGLKAMPGKEVVFTMTNDAKPAVLQPADDASYLYILMPIKSS
jgi:DNA polymerase-3 subunit beta